MSLRHGVLRGAISLGSARMAMSLLNAASIIILARILSPDDFGIVAIAMAVVSVIAAVTEASLHQSLVQCDEPTQDHIDTVWTMSCLRAGLIFTVIALAAWPLSLVYGDERLGAVFLVAGVGGAFMEFYNPLLTMATREMRFGPFAAFQIGQKAAGLGLAIGLALALGNFWGIIIGNALGAVFASLASYLIIPYRPSFTLSRVSEIWGFSGWMSLHQLCETINWRFDQLALGVAVSKVELGQYSVADSVAVIPTRELSFPLRNALFPGFAQISAQPAKLREAFLEAQSGVALVTAPAAVGLALLAYPTVDLLLGARWITIVPLLQLLAITYAFDTFITVIRPLGMAMGATKLLFLRQLLGLFVRIPLIIGGLALGGLVGAAAGRALSSLVNCLISFMLAKQLVSVGVWEQVRAHGMTLTCLLAMSAAVIAAQTALPPAIANQPLFQIPALMPIGALTYAGSAFGLWHVTGRRSGPVKELLRISMRVSDLAVFRHLRRT
ncbi:lipopolysaccharide biosynthesis protein [Sphingorhabdus pulchriflava]|uniref:Lipopolysaccharide biosynthesis protein n=1 Tax=Sphingorhabdus pulchriflava TaxID=2292257 RepID=A0A371BI18_9SPHN|nr:lipopolysaccharide biosynthesis protein [Sphingorhabdus pulchriflava]RDV07235.1 lipopolysaccharide biosynthesis protein [Sphingorhabdus pulchriflava]